MQDTGHLGKWEQLHSLSRFRPKYPSESVVRFVRGNFPESAHAHIADLGCGAGRHVLFMSQEGYQVTGADFSSTGLQYTRQLLQDRQLEAELMECSVLELPFEDEAFDGIVSFGVIYYFVWEDIVTIVDEMYRVLKNNGKALVVVRSTLDKRFGKGEEIERHTFRMKDNSSNEESMLIHFFEPEEIRQLFSKFSHCTIGFEHIGDDESDQGNFDYLITLQK